MQNSRHLSGVVSEALGLVKGAWRSFGGPRLIIASTLVALCSRSFAQAPSTTTLTFSDSQPRVAWVQDGTPSAPPKELSKVTGMTVDLTGGPSDKNAIAYVWDQTKGLIASRKLSDFKNGVWGVEDSDFNVIAAVKLSVDHNGVPISAANVELKDVQRAQSQLLDASAKGVLEFFYVKPGKVQATVQYRSKGSMASPVTQEFTLTSSSGDPETVLKISVPEDTETVGASTPTPATAIAPGATSSLASTPVAPPAPTVHSSPFGSFIVLLVVLGAIVAVGYFGLKYMKNNPETTRLALEQLGAQIPKPGDAGLNQGIPAVPLAAPASPAPVQKIVLDGASPDIYTPSAATTGFSSPMPSGGGGAPHFRSTSGDSIPIADGLVVGRDPGLGLSLVGESSVSRRHAEIATRPEGVVLKDLGSTNGTYVNGAKLQGETVLRFGDDVRFGAISFRFEG